MKPIVTDPAPAVTGFNLDVRINRLATATARQKREALHLPRSYGGAAIPVAAFRLVRITQLLSRSGWNASDAQRQHAHAVV
jgi:hypothetical protein